MQFTSGKDSMSIYASRPRRALLAGLAGIFLMTLSLQAAFDLLLENPDARDAARGESSLALAQGVLPSLRNPAALSLASGQEVGLSYVDHLQDISVLGTSWGGLEWKGNRLALHFLRLDWGDFEGLDEQANPTGSFEAGENLVLAGIARQLPDVGDGQLHAGLQAGFVNSKLDDESASAMLLNAGLRWQRSQLSLAASLRNAGTVLSEYGSSGIDLPASLDLGGAYRLKHLPFTMSIGWRKTRDRDAFLSLGGGFELARRWQIDFGYHLGRGDDRLSGVSGEGSRGISAGVGGALPRGFRFHWAWSSYGELGSLNRFTLSWQPGSGASD